MTLAEKIKDKTPDMIMVGVILMAVLLAFGFGRSMWETARAQIAQGNLDESVSKTAAGQFAVENFTTCKKAGGPLRSPASDALCITETVSGAEKLKGSGFGAQVSHELTDWLEQSKKLRGQ